MKNRYLQITLIILIVRIFTGCSTIKRITYLSEHVSISPDDKKIIFSVYKGNIASIYISDIDGRNAKQLTYPKKQFHMYPEFFSNGKKILFLSFPNKANRPQSYLYIMDISGLNLKQITFDKQHIVEAIPSSDSRSIYFLKSNYYGHYSPMASSKPHEFDLYSMNIDGTNSKRITTLSRYEIESISIPADGENILFLNGIYDNASLVLFSLETSNMLALKPYELDLFHYIAHPNLSFDGHSIDFVDVSDKKLFAGKSTSFYHTYKICLMNIDTKEVKQLTKFSGFLDSKEPHSLCHFHNQEKLIFILGHGRNYGYPKLMQINLDGSSLDEIIIRK
jgi:TolB protein